MSDIDDLSRELTEEIEAHRVTRERAEKAEAERDEQRKEIERWKELHEIYQGGAYREEDRKNAWKVRAGKAEAERDEAQRVAKVLATHGYESCGAEECMDARCVAKRTALAYQVDP